MPGINEYGGLPAGLFRQARSSQYMDEHADSSIAARGCQDPNIASIARTFACALRDARPNVTLPPHIFIPWKAQNWFVETRFILNGSATAAVDNGANAAAAAEGITSVAETTGSLFVTNPGVLGIGSGTLTVPQGKVAVIRSWAAQCDDNGYFLDVNTQMPFVQFVLSIDGNRSILAPWLLGNAGDVEHPFDVSYIVPAGQTMAVLARSSDQNMWHLIETTMSGYYIEVKDINDTLAGLVGTGTC